MSVPFPIVGLTQTAPDEPFIQWLVFDIVRQGTDTILVHDAPPNEPIAFYAPALPAGIKPRVGGVTLHAMRGSAEDDVREQHRRAKRGARALHEMAN